MGLIDLIFKKQIENSSLEENDIINLPKQKKEKRKVEDSLNSSSSFSSNPNLKNINVYSPKNMQEIEKIVLNLKNFEASIINLKGIEKIDYIKILDFLNGATFALNAHISRLTGDLYLISPENVKIKTLK